MFVAIDWHKSILETFNGEICTRHFNRQPKMAIDRYWYSSLEMF